MRTTCFAASGCDLEQRDCGGHILAGPFELGQQQAPGDDQLLLDRRSRGSIAEGVGVGLAMWTHCCSQACLQPVTLRQPGLEVVRQRRHTREPRARTAGSRALVTAAAGRQNQVQRVRGTFMRTPAAATPAHCELPRSTRPPPATRSHPRSPAPPVSERIHIGASTNIRELAPTTARQPPEGPQSLELDSPILRQTRHMHPIPRAL